MPTISTIKLNSIWENTVVTVLDTANVNNVIWLYISFTVYDSPSNYKGWIKESDTVSYTIDKISSVLSDIKVKIGEPVYETEDFADIKSIKPIIATDNDYGRIIEKKDEYLKLSCAGGRSIWVKYSSAIYPAVD